MKFIPILFSTPMVQAINEGRKTMTRISVNPQPIKQEAVETFCKLGPGSVNAIDLTAADIEFDDLIDKCPYGQPGDILWGRETVSRFSMGGYFAYKSDNDPDDENTKWRPSIHMPKAACRIFLKVKSVRVERLQDISELDAKSEGIEIYPIEGYNSQNPPDPKFMGKKYDYPKSFIGERIIRLVPIESFKSLWASINGHESLKLNPWVWVIEFDRVDLTPEQKHKFLNN